MSADARPTALITGASSGLGEAFARALAARGHDLVLVARRKDRLDALASQLRQAHRVATEVLPANLASTAGVAEIEHKIGSMASLDVLVNNAGFGTNELFAESDIERQIAMIELHVAATTRLCRAALPAMLARKRGALVNVASVGAFLCASRNVTYNATKAYLVSFTRSLSVELAGTGVRVQALCPGFTRTEFHAHDEFAGLDLSVLPRMLWGDAAEVVGASLRALDQGKPVVLLPRWRDRALVLAARLPFVSRAFLARAHRAGTPDTNADPKRIPVS